MYEERDLYKEQNRESSEESKVEHCFFPWTIKNFLLGSRKYPDSLGTLLFSASDDETFSLWQLDLIMEDSQNDIKIELTRLKSQNTALVFVRFHWEILDADGNKVFPGSIHAFAYPNYRVSKKFVESDTLLEDQPRFLPDGSLRVLCEMSVYERTVEEKISMFIKENITHALNGLTEDLEKLLESESGADLCVSSADSMVRCHKSILSVRSHKFAELIAKNPDEQHLNLSVMKGDVLHAIILHIYSGSPDMYMAHTIPKDLYSEAERFGLKHLKQHLDHVNSNGLTRLNSLDLTWKLPFFKILILREKVALYCPEQNTNTFYDKRWCFKLEFDSSREGVDISVVRKQNECSTHFVRFVVQVESFGRIAFEKVSYLAFVVDETQGMTNFLTKSELSELLSFEDTLVLKCTLEVLHYVRNPPDVKESNLKVLIEKITDHTEESILKLAEDLRRMYMRKTFSDAVVNTSLGEVSYHSSLASARFGLPETVLKTFLEDLDCKLVESFFLFLYGGDIVRSKAIGLKWAAERSQLKNLVEKFEEFLLFYHA